MLSNKFSQKFRWEEHKRKNFDMSCAWRSLFIWRLYPDDVHCWFGGKCKNSDSTGGCFHSVGSFAAGSMFCISLVVLSSGSQETQCQWMCLGRQWAKQFEVVNVLFELTWGDRYTFVVHFLWTTLNCSALHWLRYVLCYVKIWMGMLYYFRNKFTSDLKCHHSSSSVQRELFKWLWANCFI